MLTAYTLSLSDAIELLPKRRGKPLSVQTIIRWIKRGCRGNFLDAEMVGGCWFTSETAVRDFLNSGPKVPAKQTRSAASIAAEDKEADAYLRSVNFYGREKEEPVGAGTAQ